MVSDNITKPTSQKCGLVLGFGKTRGKMLVYFDFSGLCTYTDYQEREVCTKKGCETLYM